MRIVIDLQGAQSTGSRNRGIGRYSTWLTKALIKNRGDHEILIALSDLFPDTIEPLRAEFGTLIGQENIRVWRAPGPTAYLPHGNSDHRRSAELIREAFIASLNPDFVLITSLFEGLVDDAVLSIGRLDRKVPTATVLYDLIPYIYREPYLANPEVALWYESKLEELRRATLVLAISDSARSEGLQHLGFTARECVSISTATDPSFRPIKVEAPREAKIRATHGLTRPFVMYTGGIDHRKNIEGLIRSYALLPATVRAQHQLAIICSIQPADRTRLRTLAQEQQLADDEVIFTGFVSEEDLLALYNLCALFVFPSWHEGFGLPALEAMACGRAVIGANTSSIPEVIGREDALFDPRDDAAICAAMLRVLSNAEFRQELERHGLEKSKDFSWDRSARLALSAIESCHSEFEASAAKTTSMTRRLKLAYVSPLPPERSGISDYSAELLPELARHYEIDAICVEGCGRDRKHRGVERVCGVDEFRANANRYDRVVYHFGNSEFHQHMFSLLREVPGVVVLHDFFLSGIVAHMDWNQSDRGGWARRLYASHGYLAVKERFGSERAENIIFRYPTNIDVLQAATGVIVHSQASLRMAQHWYGLESTKHWNQIPLLRESPRTVNRAEARRRLGVDPDAFLLCSFGMIAPTKLSQRLLQAWVGSKLSLGRENQLVFVGANDGGDYGKSLLQEINTQGLGKSVQITGWTSLETFRDYLAAADVAVQLRTLSRGETSAAVLDCMAYGLPTIVNANGSMADLPDDAVFKIDDAFDDSALVHAIKQLRDSSERRQALARKAREAIATTHSPRQCASQYRDAIEAFSAKADTQGGGLFRALLASGQAITPVTLSNWSQAIALNQPPAPRRRQLLVDVSVLRIHDSRTGIQRVVRSVLQHWLENPPEGFAVEPIYAAPGERGYRYARKFTLGFIGCPQDALEDAAVEYASGDICLILDLDPVIQVDQKAVLHTWRRAGVNVHFVIYDLLPVRLREAFSDDMSSRFQNWLLLATEMDGAICISRAVADELMDWLQVYGAPRSRPLEVSWFHLGADLQTSLPTVGMPSDAGKTLELLKSRTTFLMVGTLEPRKGHAQALAAFELLWEQGVQVNLAIIGKRGWMVDTLADALGNHPELGKRLFWLEGISDEYLDEVYSASTCLLAASIGEGFGLPLIEAGQKGLQLLVRDLPVFREVAGDHAVYFEGKSPEALSLAVLRWLDLADQNQLPRGRTLAALTWKQSAEQLFNSAVGERPYLVWSHDGAHRYWGNDARLHTQIGRCEGTSIHSSGDAGFLVFGPYLALSAGNYVIKVHGALGNAPGDGAFFDVAADRGALRFEKQGIAVPIRDGTLLGEQQVLLDASCADLEIRVWVGAGSTISVSLIEIIPALPAETPEGEKIGSDDQAMTPTPVEAPASIVQVTPSAHSSGPQGRNFQHGKKAKHGKRTR